MNPFLVGLLWGLLIGLIAVPIGAIIYWKYKQTQMRRKVKRLLNSGEILQPMDKKDYNGEGWKDKFPVEGIPSAMEKLNDIFIKPDKPEEEEVDEEALKKHEEYKEEYDAAVTKMQEELNKKEPEEPIPEPIQEEVEEEVEEEVSIDKELEELEKQSNTEEKIEKDEF